MGGAVKAVTGALGSILGVGGSPSVSVSSEQETEAPTEDTEAVKAARRKSIERQQQRGGRNSTILGGSNRLGG